MRNLLEMERSMLENCSTFQSTFNELDLLNEQINTSYETKLKAKIKQGKLAIECKKWLKKPTTKRMFESNDLLIWSIDEMAMKFFNVKQSQMNRMAKAYKSTQANSEHFQNFLDKCNEEEENGKNVVRSIDISNKYVKGLVTDNQENVSATIPTIFTMAFKITEVEQNAQRNIAIRINENREITTQNSVEEIQQAIDFLSAAIVNNHEDIDNENSPIASETFVDIDTGISVGIVE